MKTTVTAAWMQREHDKIHAKKTWEGFRKALSEHIIWEERFLFPRLIELGYGRQIHELRKEHDSILNGMATCGDAREEAILDRIIDHHGKEEVAFLRSHRISVSV